MLRELVLEVLDALVRAAAQQSVVHVHTQCDEDSVLEARVQAGMNRAASEQ
jgi:citrate lyase gamma subunit